MQKDTNENTETRFGFGANWKLFLDKINDAKIEEAEQSLRKNLGDISGKSFIDIGCGSGLFSLAARRLGAKVFSFDYDNDSVSCTEYLKEKYFPEDKDWHVEQGSVLDKEYMEQLDKFDIVYSWGVLHHTGDMWTAIDQASKLVKDSGSFFIAIYNDQGGMSKIWTKIKILYNKSPRFIKNVIAGTTLAFFELRSFLIQILFLRNPITWLKKQKQERGMDMWIDAKDWVGGYPFEVARPEEIFDFCKERGFTLTNMKTCGGGIGCNEFVFKKS